MSFTAVILKLPFSALSTVRWGEERRGAPRKGPRVLLARSGGTDPSGAKGGRRAAPAPPGAVPQLVPADRSVLDEDMALSLGITVVRSGCSRERTLAGLLQKQLPALS